MDGLSSRPATVSEASALAAVYRNAYRENRELGFPAKAESVTAETVTEWIEAYRVFLATVEEEIVGGVRLEETEPDRLKVSRLGVHEDWKGKGIGSNLMDHVETVARRDDYQTIWLTTPEDHPFLADFYRSRGYEQTGEYPLDYREYDEIILEKQVASEEGS